MASPVANPVIRSNVDQQANITLEELRDMGIRFVVFVQHRRKRVKNIVTTNLETLGDDRAYTELLADGCLGRVVDHVSERWSPRVRDTQA